MSRAWKRGSTRAWRRTRAAVLARDGYRCRLALSGTWTTYTGQPRHCLGRADAVHHLRGKAMGDDPAYLVAACAPCNQKVGDPTKQPDPAPRPRTRW